MQFLHFKDLIEFLKELHGETLLSKVIVALNDDMDKLVSRQVAVRR